MQIYIVEGSCAFGGKICPLQEKSNGHKSSAEADDGCESEVEQENGIIFSDEDVLEIIVLKLI